MKRLSLLSLPPSILLPSSILAAVLWAPSGYGQVPSRPPAGKTLDQIWTQTRTSDGAPDLHGVWTNRTITPFERPVELGGKAHWTEAEAAEIEKRAAQNQVDRPPQAGDPGT
jgi:hypothetical protein